MAYMAPGPAPESARGVMTLRCEARNAAKPDLFAEIDEIEEWPNDPLRP